MSLSETLARLDQFGARLKSDCGENGLALIRHKFKITDFAKSLDGRKEAKPSSKIELDLLAIWKLFCETSDPTLISPRILRKLASSEEMYSDLRFVDFICKQPNLNAGTLRAIVSGCLTTWKKLDWHDQLLHFVRSTVQNYIGRDSKILLWKAQSDCILSVEAPRNFARYAVGKRLGLRGSFESFGFDSYLGAFSKHVADALVTEISAQISDSAAFNQELWYYVHTTYIIRKDVSKGHQCRVLSEVIVALHEKRGGGVWQTAREQLIDFVLASKDFGDPRAKKSAWSDVSLEAQKCFISWLSEKDLAFFFELIIDHDPHSRKNFWINYVNSVNDSRIVLCEQDELKHAALLKQQKGQRFSAAKLRNSSTSAFILDFGKYVVVEFSRTGNACYIYEKESFDQATDGMFQSAFNMSKLKNASVKSTQSHHAGWETALRPTLASLGIRPS